MKPSAFIAGQFSPEPGITLIEASAGTGKTYSITKIICNLIASGAGRIDEILVLTFTETATQELRDRIRSAIREEIHNATQRGEERTITHLSDALDNFESAAIFTIHGFCNRILREFSLEAGIGPEFAILKNPSVFQDQLETEVAREIQEDALKNPFIALGLHALGLKTGFIKQTLNLRDSEDLRDSGAGVSALFQTFFRDAFASLQQAWMLEHLDLRADLLSDDAPIQKRRKAYKNEELEALFDRLHTAFQNGGQRLYLDFLIDIQHLSRSTLEDPKVLKSGRSLAPLLFYGQCDQAWQQLQEFSKLLVQRILEIRNQRVNTLVYREQTLRFDDLLSFSRSIVEHPSRRFAHLLYQRYKVALIDEFQDTDPVQYAILHGIFQKPPAQEKPRPMVLIGDPKQAVYGFRGGDIFTYNLAKKEARQVFFLDTNWRSSTAINEGVNELLSVSSAPFGFDWISYQPVKTAAKNTNQCLLRRLPQAGWQVQSGIEWIELESGTSNFDKIERVALDISELLHSESWIQTPDGVKSLGPSDIAVLVPDNKNGARIHEALGQQQVSSSIFGGASVFQTSQALQLYAVLHAMQNPRDFSLVNGASTSSFFDSHFHPQNARDGTEGSTELLRDISTASDLWHDRGLSVALGYLSRKYHWKKNLASLNAANRVLANHQQVLDLLIDQEAQGVADPETLLKWFREHIEEPDSKDQDQLLQLDTDEAAVTIMTMHKSKGLEFPVVFIPFLPAKSGRPPKYPHQYHDLRTGELRTTLSKEFASATALASREAEAASESLRTTYVAITRAKIACYLYLQPEEHNESVLDAWLPIAGELSERIQLLQHRAKLSPVPADPSLPTGTVSTPENSLTSPENPPPVPSTKTHLSFTGIVTGASGETMLNTDEPVLFSYNPQSAKQGSETEPPHTLFDFDKGTNAGLLFHDILEYADFNDPSGWRELIESKLEQFGYSSERWTPVFVTWLQKLVESPLKFPKSAPTSLQSFRTEMLFRETEFSFPIVWGEQTWRKLSSLFSEASWLLQLGYRLPDLQVVRLTLQAFVNGIVDCWYIENGKVMLIDWKSNHLGSDLEAYNTNSIVEAMNEHHYHLQYLLYIAAINRYLRLVTTGYDYERDFAGVGYCFLRGINSKTENAGWFICLPPADFILQLEKILLDQTEAGIRGKGGNDE